MQIELSQDELTEAVIAYVERTHPEYKVKAVGYRSWQTPNAQMNHRGLVEGTFTVQVRVLRRPEPDK